MRASVSVRILRTLLALSVSLWMAGTGCMLGCGNTVVAAEQNPKTVIAGPSCHHSSHDCCAKKSSSPTVNPDVKTSQETLLLLSAVPDGMMLDCPLAVNATAVAASKVSHQTPEQARTSPAELSSVESITQNLDWAPPAPQFLNRGPTYLRCCVFLI